MAAAKTSAEQVNPAAMTPEQMAKLLSKASGKAIQVSVISTDLERGAPLNRDGTIHLVHYTAWLASQVT